MSQQRRRKRAQERTYGHQPKPRPVSDPAAATSTGPKKPSKPPVSAKKRRHRKVLVILIALAVAANLITWLLFDAWNIRWVVLTLSVISVPVAYFLLVNPEKDTGL